VRPQHPAPIQAVAIASDRARGLRENATGTKRDVVSGVLERRAVAMTKMNRAVCMAALAAAITLGMAAEPAEAKRQRTDPGPRWVDVTKRRVALDAKVQRGDPGRHPIDVLAIRRAVVDALRRVR
jgi:hypothetical protein